ncbi:XRE family transcriptional regulator [Lacibacter luteus]|uniref:XRE family transcriptional regulator n=1 Tax=Lacibacter luteus TaxID=2508719 RepID=A0A4Q1CF54_9BACT|nr:helix-turn-helix transcriptional regulator [Lacibacter luteus]RXK58409.1 XRE family transcriptional regulator [Lacibacter luteus]
MEVYKKIVHARKQKGLTQEQLADLSNVTVRTIQRIESGESMPRAYTLKAIATALNISFEELTADNNLAEHLPASESTVQTPDYTDSKHTLKIICLSCFSYLVVPFIHFLIPTRLLKKSNEQNPTIVAFAKKMIRTQLYWKVALWLLLLGTLAYNLIMAAWFQKNYLISYLVPFFAMYFLNAIIISITLLRIQKTDFSLK